MRNYSEDALVEQPAIALFARLGYETINAFHEKPGRRSMLGRETLHEVVLVSRLRAALHKLNPGVARRAIELDISVATRGELLLHPLPAQVRRGFPAHFRFVFRTGTEYLYGGVIYARAVLKRN